LQDAIFLAETPSAAFAIQNNKDTPGCCNVYSTVNLG